MKRWKKALIIIGIIVLILVIGGIVLWNYLFGGMKHVDLDRNELGIEDVSDWFFEDEDYDDISEAADNNADAAEVIDTAGVNDTAEVNNIAEAKDTTSVNDAAGADNAAGNVTDTAANGEAAGDVINDLSENTENESIEAALAGDAAEAANAGVQAAGTPDEQTSENAQEAGTPASQTTEKSQAAENTGTPADKDAQPAETKAVKKEKHDIKNLVVFGMSVSEVGGIDTDRSDMNLIVSIDQDNNRICMTNILRDSKVPIEGHDPQKINAAYKYGGPVLAIKTLNQNFHLNIDDYITINFEGMIEMVDYFGGVDINLTEAESTKVPNTTEGMNHLDGKQALAYAGIRYIDSDFYRASRQQNVLMAILEKIKSKPKTSYPEIVSKLMNCIETSLEVGDILDLVESIDLNKITLVRNTIPDYSYEEGLWGGIDDTGSWVYVYDLEEAAKRIHRIIYGGSIDGAKPEKKTEQ